MKYLHTRTGKFFSGIVSAFIALSIILTPISQTLEVQKAEAQWAVIDATNYVANYGSWIESAASAAYNAITSAASENLWIKEYVLDGILWALVNLMLEQMVKSVTQWVAGGFQGSPAFVQDLQGFVMDLADKVAGDFIYGSSLSALCSPFKLNIQFALNVQYSKSRTYTAKCSLTSVVNNVSNFMEGDFLSGGWNEWFNMTQTPGNNQYGALMEATAGMSATIRNARGEEIKLLDFGKGLMSLKDANGKVITPGTAIESSLNESIATPGKRLTVADEIDELLGVLLSQLVSTVLTSATGGLAGLSTSGQNSAYFTSVAAQTATQGSSNGGSLFSTHLQTLNEYLGYQNTIVSTITSAESYALNSCLASGLNGSLSSQRSTAQSAISSFTIVSNAIKQYESDYNALGSNPTNALMSKYSATDVATAQANLMTQYQGYIASAGLPTSATNVQLKISTVPAIQKEAQDYQRAIAFQCQTNSTNTP